MIILHKLSYYNNTRATDDISNGENIHFYVWVTTAVTCDTHFWVNNYFINSNVPVDFICSMWVIWIVVGYVKHMWYQEISTTVNSQYPANITATDEVWEGRIDSRSGGNLLKCWLGPAWSHVHHLFSNPGQSRIQGKWYTGQKYNSFVGIETTQI